MRKLFILLVVALGLIVLPAGVSAQEGVTSQFYDLSYSHPNFTAIDYLRQLGVVRGYADGSFRPFEQINRAEFIGMIVRSRGMWPDFDSNTRCFSDVRSSWFANEICYAKDKGWLNGMVTTSKLFRPYKKLTRNEAEMLISNVFRTRSFNIDDSGSRLTRAQASQLLYDVVNLTPVFQPIFDQVYRSPEYPDAKPYYTYLPASTLTFPTYYYPTSTTYPTYQQPYYQPTYQPYQASSVTVPTGYPRPWMP